MCQIEIVLICLKKKPHCNPVSVRLVCVCVCVYKWEEADLFVCPLCSPLHGSFLTRNSSRAIQPPPTLTITVLRKILTKRSCWESPNWGRWHKNGGKKGQKEWKQKRESGGKKLMSKNNYLVSKDLQPSHQEAQVPNLSIVSTPCTDRKTMHWQKLQISAQFTQPLISTHRHTQYKSIMYLYSVFEVF